ncbi:DeoR/GlpR family DNA-binding transcription regulator [Nocardioides sp.]|uniref:DeoR/GlpR family DNA-binding transcription regulator n=1 Tax=Nocardioides sp. TaxID=35761 RepID=UPI0035636635
MYAEERHQAIVELVASRGRVSVTELASHFEVTSETVRRDLSTLERMSLLRRVHGGAVSARSLTRIEAQLSDRDQSCAEEKDRIAQAAITLLPPTGCSVLMDAGSTTARVAALLPSNAQWTVITHAVPIAALLAPLAHIELHLLPGRVRTATQAAVGHVTVDALRDFRADVAFIGTNGITVRHGLSTPDPEEAATKRAIVDSAQRVITVADSTKVGQERTKRFADIEDIDTLVTDSAIDPDARSAFEAAGVHVVEA